MKMSIMLFVTLLATMLSSTLAEPITVNATCDNEMTFYAGGVEMTENRDDDWRYKSTFTLPECTASVAIYCKDFHVVAGILASVSDGTVTDGTWKCTNTHQPGWETPTFDDNAWSNAYVITSNDGSGPRWTHVTDIDVNANWIWTTGWTGGDKDVYCRKTIDTAGCGGQGQGYDCTNNNPCTAANIAAEDFYHPHTNPAMFVQCSEWGQCYEMPCPAGLVWNDVISACDWP